MGLGREYIGVMIMVEAVRVPVLMTRLLLITTHDEPFGELLRNKPIHFYHNNKLRQYLTNGGHHALIYYII